MKDPLFRISIIYALQLAQTRMEYKNSVGMEYEQNAV